MSEPKKALDIELLELDISGLPVAGESRHVLTAELIWPRVLVSSRTAMMTLKLQKGVVDLRERLWTRRILFKESVEHDFGLLIKVSQSMTSAAFDEMVRYMGGAVLGGVATLVDNGVGGGVLGDAVGSPFSYLKKKAQASYSAQNLAEGCADLHSASLKGESELKIPLLALSNRYETHVSTEKGHPTTRKRVMVAGSQCGYAILRIKCLG